MSVSAVVGCDSRTRYFSNNHVATDEDFMCPQVEHTVGVVGVIVGIADKHT